MVMQFVDGHYQDGSYYPTIENTHVKPWAGDWRRLQQRIQSQGECGMCLIYVLI